MKNNFRTNYRKTSCNSRTRVIRAPHILGGKCGKKICKKNDSQKKFFFKFKKREVTPIPKSLDNKSVLPLFSLAPYN